MATRPKIEVIEHLRRTVLLRDGSGQTDGQLLGCFIEHRDEAAFAALVRRHGPMVWGVCRRLLGHHDAEDGFQATFLVLARKAASVVPREMLANWLYGVARQTALQARRAAARRRTRERPMTVMPEPAAADQDLWHDLKPLLDEALSCLPDKYRAVLVLCDLEGKTRKEAARQLGVPEGTTASRLATARKMLAGRLARCGVALSGGALAGVLSQVAASAGVPPSVVSSTIEAASLLAAGPAAGEISAKVAALTEGVLKTMLLMSKLRITTAVVVAVGVLAVAAATLFLPAAVGTAAGDDTDKTVRTAAGGDSDQEVHQADSGQADESHHVQVRITRPQGMTVAVVTASGQNNRSPSIEVPGRLSLRQGEVHRLKLTDIPNRPGLEVFPTVETPRPDEATKPFITNSAVAIEFTAEDFDQVLGGNVVTKVVYLPRGRGGEPATIASYNLEPGRDIIVEARRRGAILAVVRMGNIDLEADKPGQGAVKEKDRPTPQAAPKSDDAQPLGRILRLTPQGDRVYINLGTADNVRPQTALSVYGADSYRPGRSPKASLEVLSITSPHLSLARVTWLHDPDREPLVEGDELYHPASGRTRGVGRVENAKQEPRRPARRAEDQPPIVGDMNVQELVHDYRGLSDNDKLGQEGDRIRERLLRLSRSEQVALTPFTRDALDGILAEHRLRQLLRAATENQDKAGRGKKDKQ